MQHVWCRCHGCLDDHCLRKRRGASSSWLPSTGSSSRLIRVDDIQLCPYAELGVSCRASSEGKGRKRYGWNSRWSQMKINWIAWFACFVLIYFAKTAWSGFECQRIVPLHCYSRLGRLWCSKTGDCDFSQWTTKWGCDFCCQGTPGDQSSNAIPETLLRLDDFEGSGQQRLDGRRIGEAASCSHSRRRRCGSCDSDEVQLMPAERCVLWPISGRPWGWGVARYGSCLRATELSCSFNLLRLKGRDLTDLSDIKFIFRAVGRCSPTLEMFSILCPISLGEVNHAMLRGCIFAGLDDWSSKHEEWLLYQSISFMVLFTCWYDVMRRVDCKNALRPGAWTFPMV